MKTLAPVDFKAVAAQGCFVYCYLRAKSSKTARAGTPYYIGVGSNATRPYMSHTRGTPVSRFHDVPVPSDKALVRLMGVFATKEEALAREAFLIHRYGRKGLDPRGTLLNRELRGRGGGTIKRAVAMRMGIPLPAWVAATRTERNRARDRFNRGVRGAANLLSMEDDKYEVMGFSKEFWCQLNIDVKRRVYTRFVRGVRSAQLLLAPKVEESARLSASAAALQEMAALRYGITVERWAALSAAERKGVIQRFARGTRGEALFSEVSLKKLEGYKVAASIGLSPEAWDALPRAKKTVMTRQLKKSEQLGISLAAYLALSPGQRMVAARNGLQAVID
jgi:hypothetical protein